MRTLAILLLLAATARATTRVPSSLAVASPLGVPGVLAAVPSPLGVPGVLAANIPPPLRPSLGVPGVLAARVLAAQDTVITKDAKKTQGRVFQFLEAVEVEGKDGKRVRISRREIDRIELESRIVHYPHLKPFPNDKIRDGDFDFASSGTVVFALPKLPATTGYAVDLLTGKTLYELDLKGRLGDPIFVGGLVYLMRLDSTVSETIKYKTGGALIAKEVHKLTVQCLDLKSGKPVWTVDYDNVEPKETQHWEFVPDQISLHLLPKHVVVYAAKRGSPVDKAGNLDRTVTKSFATFYLFNQEKMKIDKQFDNEEAGKTSGYHVVEDHFVYLWYDGRDTYKIKTIGLKEGKQKWESEGFRGRIAAVAGRRVFARDDNVLWTYDIAGGRRDKEWSLEHGNEIAAIDDEFVIQFRKSKLPRAIIGYDITKKPVEHFRIAMDANEEFTWRGRIGHLMFYTNRAQTLVCYDVYAKKEVWRYAGTGNGEPRHIFAVGSGVTFYKDNLVTHVDLATAKVVWVSYGDYMRIVQGGDVGVIGLKRGGSDLIIERTLPPGARFATSTGTPLRNLFVDDICGPAAVADDMLVTFTNKGRLVAINLKTMSTAWNVRVAEDIQSTPAQVEIRAGKVFIATTGKAHILNLQDGAKLQTLSHYVPVASKPFLFVGDNVVLCDSNGGARLVEPATGKVAWWAKEFNNAHGWETDGKQIWFIAGQQVFPVDCATGKAAAPIAVPQSTNHFAVAGDVVLLACGGYRAGAYSVDRHLFSWKVDAANQDQSLSIKYGGRFALVNGVMVWANHDSQVVGLDPAQEGKVLWKVEGRPFPSAFLVHEGRVLVSIPGVGLHSIDAKTGAVAWKLEIEDAHLFTPVRIGGKPCFWSSDGWMIEVP